MGLLLPPDQWDSYHKAAVLFALERTYREGQDSGHMYASMADVFGGYRNILAGTTPAVIVDGYLIIYEVGQSCLSPAPILFECLVVRLGSYPHSLAAVPKALDELARLHGCKWIVAGNSIKRPGLTRVYERAGFKQSSVQLMKEVI